MPRKSTNHLIFFLPQISESRVVKHYLQPQFALLRERMVTIPYRKGVGLRGERRGNEGIFERKRIEGGL